MSKRSPKSSVVLRSAAPAGSGKGRKKLQRAVYTPGPQSALEATRFETFLRGLGPHLPEVPTDLRVALCCLAYEGICSRSDFDALLSQIEKASAAPGGMRVTMPDQDMRPGRDQVRLLATKTRLAIGLLDAPLKLTKVTEQISVWLATHYLKEGASPRTSLLDQVLYDSSAWLYYCLPSAIYAYVRQDNAIAALPTEVLQRLKIDNTQATDAVQAATSFSTALSENDPLLSVEEHALEKILSPVIARLVSFPTRTIGVLKNITSVPGDGHEPRAGDHIVRQQAKSRLIGIVELIHDEGHVAAVLVGWVMHLFTAGSLRRANPAIGTLSAYINALTEPLARTLVELATPLVALGQDQWYKLFNDLAALGGSTAYGPALATFHLWAVDTYGCDPMRGIIFNKVEDIRVHANVVWPSEREELLSKAGSVSLDPRVSQQVRVMAALGSAGTFRIGDLMPLRISQIVFLDSGILVICDPASGLHKGKGKGARRVVFIPEGIECDIIKAWAAIRRKESFDDDEMLFGDPGRPNDLYRFAHCCLLLNRLLKQVTGDNTVSFHTLRHTTASNRALGILQNSDQSSAVSELDELQYAMGHRTRTTIWSTYFHFPEYAIRQAIDSSPAVHSMEEKEAAFWTAGEVGALRKSKSRAAMNVGEAGRSRFFHDKIERIGQGIEAWSHVPGQSVAIASLVSMPARALNFKFDLRWVTLALRDLLRTDDVNAIASRLSCLPSHVEQLASAAAAIIATLDPLTGRKIKGPLLPGAHARTSIAWMRDVIGAHKFRLDFDGSPHVKRLVTFASSSLNKGISSEAARAWRQCKRAGTVSLSSLQTASPVVRMLLEAGVPASSLIARLQCEEADLANRQAALDRFATEWINVMGVETPVEWVRKRRGAPEQYLLCTDRPHQSSTTASPRSMSMRRFHGFFFCLALTHQLNSDSLQP